MNWNRTDRLAETIRQEIIEIIEYELTDDRIGYPVVTGVKLSQDTRNATIFVSIDGDKQKIKECLDALRHAAGFIRHSLASRLQVKRIPELAFKNDDTMQKAARIEQLLGEEIEKEQKA